MRKGLLVLLAIATVCILTVPTVMAADQDPGTSYTLNFTGKISHGSQPIESPNTMHIKILRWDDDTGYNVIGNYEGKLGQDGEFSIPRVDVVADGTYYLSIKEEGYTAYNWPEDLKQIDTDFFEFKIIESKIKDGSYYPLTTDHHNIIMTSAFGSVSGKIVSSGGGNPPLNGVKVTITSVNGDSVWTTFTHGDGSFKFDNVGVGNYKLVAESRGFKTYEHPNDVPISAGNENKLSTIKMDPTDEMVSSHWMTIGGIIAAMVLIILIVIHIIRLRKKKSLESSLE